MYWEIELDNGEVIREDGSDIRHWGKVVKRCHTEGLKIREFRLVNREGNRSKVIDKLADRYFVINDVLATMGSGGQETKSKRGIGSVRGGESNKTRVEWYRWPDRRFITVEVTRGIQSHIPEISVERAKG